MPRLSAASAAAGLLLLSTGAAFAQAPAGQTPTAIDRLLAERSARPDPNAPTCLLPPPERGQVTVLVGAYGGAGTSTAALTGPDQPTTHAFVDIEPGQGPLYLVLSAYEPTVWTFRGAVGRVARAVLAAPNGAGAVGLPAARVQVLSDGACDFGFSDPASPQAARARATLMRAIGREPVAIAGAYALGAVSLPSGRVTVGGPVRDLARVDPAAVVGAQAETFAVLPGSFGIEQLVQSGALQRLGGRDYRVSAPIARWPAGLTGANSARFLLARGVPYPAGDPGHSCVVSEETGGPVPRPGLAAFTGPDAAEMQAERDRLFCGSEG
jgi:hypothetical protein